MTLDLILPMMQRVIVVTICQQMRIWLLRMTLQPQPGQGPGMLAVMRG